MLIVKQSHKIIRFYPEDELYKIARGYCRCYNSPIPKTHEERCDLVRRHRKHSSPIEHGYLTVEFVTNVGIANELVRHRHAAYSQESTRYCNYSKNKFSNQLSFIWDNHYAVDTEAYGLWVKGRNADETEYLNRLKNGETPEQARGCLPKDLATVIEMSANLREWHSIFELRCDKHAHYQMRELMIPLYKEINESLPCIFDDISISE